MTKVALFCPNCGEEKDLNKEETYQCEKCGKYYGFTRQGTYNPRAKIWEVPGLTGFCVSSNSEWHGVGRPSAEVCLTLCGVLRDDVKSTVKELREEVNKTVKRLERLVRKDGGV